MVSVGIVNYGVGNIFSIVNAVAAVGGIPVLSSDSDELINCDALILPGVGSYSHGMTELIRLNLDDIILQAIDKEQRVLGICLGMQLLTRGSFEFGWSEGLSVFESETEPLTSLIGEGARLPNVGWEEVVFHSKSDPIFDGVEVSSKFYFIHSFGVAPDSECVVASARAHGGEFAAVIRKGSVVATQFHPEKSGKAGLQVLKNFIFGSELVND